jgi:hypothetical protein
MKRIDKPFGTDPPEQPDKPLLLECLYTPEQAGRYLNMSERMMMRRLDSGSIGHVKVGRVRYISGGQIVSFISENSVEPLPDHLRPRLAEV